MTFDRGGWLPQPGPAVNLSGQPESVFPLDDDGDTVIRGGD